jgi:hypothetical protein
MKTRRNVRKIGITDRVAATEAGLPQSMNRKENTSMTRKNEFI